MALVSWERNGYPQLGVFQGDQSSDRMTSKHVVVIPHQQIPGNQASHTVADERNSSGAFEFAMYFAKLLPPALMLQASP